MGGLRLPLHGRNHRLGGEDPIKVGLFEIKLADDLTTATVGDNAFIMCVPQDLDKTRLVKVAAFVTTVGSGTTIALRNVTQGRDLLTTSITIDDSEFTSYTANAPAVIDTARTPPNPPNNQVAAGDLIAVDVDAATGLGHGVMLGFS